MERGTTYVAFDSSKETIAVAVAEGGNYGEVRFFGTIASCPEAVDKLIEKLAQRHKQPVFCYEAGPTGYTLYRQIRSLGYECHVVAPSMVPVRPGGHIKTDRRYATTLAAHFRAGELTPVWVPDAAHEAMRDLVRARHAAMESVRRARQQLLSFLLRHGRIFPTRRHWTRGHRRWLAEQRFDHAAQQIVFQELIHAVEQPIDRRGRLEEQMVCSGSELVAAARGGGTPGTARIGNRRRHHAGGRDRRLPTLHQSSVACGMARAAAARTLLGRERWTVPLGGGFGRVFKIGDQPVNAQLAAYYNVVKPTDGAN